VNSLVSLQNLYFDRNRVELNGNDKMALANTLIALRNSPTLTIEIAVRAECNETEEIAAKRAEAIKQYFADKSDYAKRITIKNYGKAKQLAGCNCDSPMVYPDEVYSLNRVAEFRIMNF
jgi:outer membrane protein OmpA-like peptidoglycan-associated protein